MKKINLLLLILGVITMTHNYGCSKGMDYSNHVSKRAEFNISVDHISDWRVGNGGGANRPYVFTAFFQPGTKNQEYAAKMVIKLVKGDKVKFTPLTVKAFADDLISKKINMAEAKVKKISSTKFLGQEAIEVIMTYKTVDMLYSPDSKLIPIKEEMIFFKKGDDFYLLQYENREEEFDKYHKAFIRCMNTLKFN